MNSVVHARVIVLNSLADAMISHRNASGAEALAGSPPWEAGLGRRQPGSGDAAPCGGDSLPIMKSMQFRALLDPGLSWCLLAAFELTAKGNRSRNRS